MPHALWSHGWQPVRRSCNDWRFINHRSFLQLWKQWQFKECFLIRLWFLFKTHRAWQIDGYFFIAAYYETVSIISSILTLSQAITTCGNFRNNRRHLKVFMVRIHLLLKFSHDCSVFIGRNHAFKLFICLIIITRKLLLLLRWRSDS